MQVGSRGYSLIQDSGTYSSSCGYCNGDGATSEAHGMHAYRMTVYDYQELLDQGWRRSGKYLYKPNNKITCCRQYTIRLKVADFKPSKAHKKLLKRWEQFVTGHLHKQDKHADTDTNMAGTGQPQQQAVAPASQQQQHRASKRSRNMRSSTGDEQPQQQHMSGACDAEQRVQHGLHDKHEAAGRVDCTSSSSSGLVLLPAVQTLLQQAVQLVVQAGQLPQQGLPDVSLVVPPQQKLSKLPAGTVLTSSCAHALAAAARKQQQRQQQAGPSSVHQQVSVTADELASLIVARFNELSAAQSTASVVAVAANGHINFTMAAQQQTSVNGQHRQQQQSPRQQQGPQTGAQQHDLAPVRGGQESQQQAHGWHHANGSQQHMLHQQHDRHAGSTSEQQQQQQQHRLEVRMVPNQFIQEEYELYCKYQIKQHHDEPEELTPSRYRHFLVDTPLIPVLPQHQQQRQAGTGGAGSGGTPACGYGSFHQQYWLDGKLVAVGVVDILPRCLSSKYFFWDPEYAWLSLGRYGALREISWVAEANAAGAAELEYYYLGYYIHSCSKMAYKAEYCPSELLCPEKQVWVGIDSTVRQALDSSPYVVLSSLPGVQMQPNLSVPRPIPAVSNGPAGASAAAPGPASEHSGYSGVQSFVRAELVQRQQLDSQLMFLLKQPVRWGALRQSGLLDAAQVSEVEERLTAWRDVVGETAAYLLYATPSDLLPLG